MRPTRGRQLPLRDPDSAREAPSSERRRDLEVVGVNNTKREHLEVVGVKKSIHNAAGKAGLLAAIHAVKICAPPAIRRYVFSQSHLIIYEHH